PPAAAGGTSGRGRPGRTPPACPPRPPRPRRDGPGRATRAGAAAGRGARAAWFASEVRPVSLSNQIRYNGAERPVAAGRGYVTADLLGAADRLFDGTAAAAVPRPALRISGERIVAPDEPTAGGPAERFDFPGCTLLPGLIDTHVHLVFS